MGRTILWVVCISIFSVVLANSVSAIELTVDHFGNDVSLAESDICSSCHIVKGSNPGQSDSDAATVFEHTHPANIIYPPAEKTRGFKSAAEVEQAGIILQNNKMTCTSCHNLQSNIDKLLRISNQNSQLCRACHKM